MNIYIGLHNLYRVRGTEPARISRVEQVVRWSGPREPPSTAPTGPPSTSLHRTNRASLHLPPPLQRASLHLPPPHQQGLPPPPSTAPTGQQRGGGGRGEQEHDLALQSFISLVFAHSIVLKPWVFVYHIITLLHLGEGEPLSSSHIVDTHPLSILAGVPL